MGFLKRNLLNVLIIAILSSFAVQTYLGEHGLQARSAYSARISGLNKKLHILKEQRSELERKTKHLSPGAVDPDMLEYQARELLNFVHKNERVYVRQAK